jgi:hypothetical protein
MGVPALQETININLGLSATFASKQFTAPPTGQQSTSTESLQDHRDRNAVDGIESRMGCAERLLRECAISGVSQPAVEYFNAGPPALNIFVNVYRTEEVKEKW